ncbi:glycosyltransferase family 2 protein [Eudoraea adriatica]|uniref:glycosyltransferase family 2 protein n=1 Tax=Eudoraea adriatica TaxID=446681 RepID=UPI00037A9616|nr:glycosyltransferase [Eudoraea adriatica]
MKEGSQKIILKAKESLGIGIKEITVSVTMITYGHERYIKEAINGVLNQECKFNVELIIADDNSPDNTEEEVSKFLKDHPRKHWVRYTKHRENKNMLKNSEWSFNQVRGKYIAICEGDDYWSDPFKLQKQVDFLEENPDYGLVYSKARVYEEKTQKFWNRTLGSAIAKNGILHTNPITALTTLMRNDLYKLYAAEEKEIRNAWAMGDYPKWIWFYYNSKIHFMNETTAVWRKLENSASNFVDPKKEMAFRYNTIKIQTYYAKKYLNDTEYLKIKNSNLFKYYYIALIKDPVNSILHYNKIKEIEGVNQITKIKLFAIEKFKFKHIYLIWFKIKRILKNPLLEKGENQVLKLVELLF